MLFHCNSMMKDTLCQLLILNQDHQSGEGAAKVYASRIVDNIGDVKI